MMSNNFVAKELYPYIMLYQGLFEDVDKVIDIIKKSELQDTNFLKWSKWSNFGRYVSQQPRLININENGYDIVNKKDSNLEGLESEQYDLTLEIEKNIYIADQDYIKRYNIDVDVSKTYQGKQVWNWSGPQYCSYDISSETKGNAGPEAFKNGLAMAYHSDYVREPVKSPKYSFVFSTLIYHNDDYEGGEIEFYVNNKQMKYTPKKGDILVFPAGHPDYLTENGKVFLHGVKSVLKNKKYISRSHWLKYEDGSDEWYEKQKEFGDSWPSEFERLYNEYQQQNPARLKIEKEGVKKIELN